MPLISLSEAIGEVRGTGGALAGLVVLGWEDACAYVRAAERIGCPVILQAGPGCRKHTPLGVLAEMFRTLAATSSVSVVAHLDHGKTPEECIEGIRAGFSSVMYDGSSLPLRENIANTNIVSSAARSAGVSVEAELGYVGYAGAEQSVGTDAEEARMFMAETDIDALAISAGNTHLSKTDNVPVDENVIRVIQNVVPTPLVLHGGSGIPLAQRRRIALETSVYKFNIGTELRQSFGQSLRTALTEQPHEFDRIALLSATVGPVSKTAEAVMRNLLN